MLARYLDNSYAGDPVAFIIGLSGRFCLWILFLATERFFSA